MDKIQNGNFDFFWNRCRSWDSSKNAVKNIFQIECPRIIDVTNLRESLVSQNGFWMKYGKIMNKVSFLWATQTHSINNQWRQACKITNILKTKTTQYSSVKISVNFSKKNNLKLLLQKYKNLRNVTNKRKIQRKILRYNEWMIVSYLASRQPRSLTPNIIIENLKHQTIYGVHVNIKDE